ncbi:MAG TPA: phosphoribosylglycinamide formyltransferase [Candidatus Methylomirabilis sp.]|nr:phosphoribosylglycinamide formyltransferase [Candidatus Methylomirabilis sp.]
MGEGARLRIGVLASGRGSNFEAIVRSVESGSVPASVAVLVTDRPDVRALDIARQHRIEAVCVDRRDYPGREMHEKQVIAVLDERRVELVCLAGYMRILSESFVKHFEGRLLNIHPSLLPSFPGLHAQGQALRYGVKVAGATVHFVHEGVDAGPIVLQAVVPVSADDTEETLADRILDEEHRIYPEAIRLFARGQLYIEGRRVRIKESA